MQKCNCAAIERTATFLLESTEPPNLIEDWLESVERIRSRVLQCLPALGYMP